MKTLSAIVLLCIITLGVSFHLKSLSVKNNTDKNFREENPLESFDALTFLSSMNAFPNADIPADAYAKAWKQQQALMSTAKTTQGGVRTAWQNIGPNNTGGRTTSIALDPTNSSVIWLGSASGGLWKSTTGGAGTNAWTYVPTGFPVLGVSAIAINPNNHNEMYIGTGETYIYGTSTNGLVDRTQRGSFGIGILKSTDGGTTWGMSLDWTYQSQRGVWDIVYDPTNTNTLYAATTEGVYKTTDGGANWNNSLNKTMVMDLCINLSQPTHVLAGVGNEDSPDHGIYKTSNGGTTWIHITNGLPAANNDGRITISSWAGNQNTLMAIIGNRFSTVGVFKSTDEGDSWTTVNTSDEIMSYQGWYSKGLLMNANNINKVVAGGVESWRSNDGGANFSTANYYTSPHSDIHDMISDPNDPDKIYAITDGGLFRSDDFGTTYYECTDGYVTSQHYIGSVSPLDPNYALGGLQDNYTQRYTGSVYWTPVLGGDGSYNAINPDDDNNAYASYQYLNVYRADDQGFTFNQILSTPSSANGGNPAAFLAPFILCPSNTQRLYAGGTWLKRSDDGGFNWNTVTPDSIDGNNVILSIAVSNTNEDSVYFATAPTPGSPMHFFRSTNGGANYTNITSSTLPNRYLRRITVDPFDSRKIYAVFSGFNGAQGGHIFKSTDAGNTWTDISITLPDMPFHCMMIDPLAPNHLYAGCDFGIYYSIDGGQTWNTFNDGFPDAVMVFDLIISSSDKTVYAFTFGHGVYKNELLPVDVSVSTVHLSKVNITPNPATNFVMISGVKEPMTVTLFDLSGRKVFEQNYSASSNAAIKIPLQDVAEGTYIIHVSTSSGEYNQKIAVM